jgi:hypothetical protein
VEKKMDKLNYKLSKFFNSKNDDMLRIANVGYLDNVTSADDLKTLYPMLNEMVQLPKYKPTIDKLKAASGFVNFVTKDGYSLLIECIIKSAFPLNTNDIFNVGDNDITGGSFAIGADYFGTTPTEKAYIRANKMMEELLFGSDALMTRQWLTDKGWSDDTIEKAFGKYKDSTVGDWIRKDQMAKAAGNPEGEPIPSEVATNRTPASELGWQMAVYEFLIKQVNARWDNFISEIDSQISGQIQEDGTIAVLDPEQIKSLKENRQMYVGMKREEVDRVKSDYLPILGPPIKERMKGTSTKNKDGFINYNPAKPIMDHSRELMKLMLNYDPNKKTEKANDPSGKTPKGKVLGELVQSHIMELRKLIPQYRSTDPSFKRISDEFLSMLGDGTPEDLLKIKSNLLGTVARLQKMLVDRLVQHGKVLILDEIDKSVLCQQGQKSGEVTMIKSFKHLISGFIAQNNSNIDKDTSPQIINGRTVSPKKENGNRVIVALSSEPIVAIPGGAETVDLDTSPVNPDEAEIIVRHLVESMDREKRIFLKYKKNEEIEKKYSESPEMITREIHRVSLTPKEMESLVPDMSRKRLASYISGLNVRDAIASIRSALRMAERKDETDPLRPKITMDTKSLLSGLKEQVNKRIQAEVLGVKLGRVDVTFDDYAYNKNSEWSKRVVGISEVKTQMDAFKTAIESDTARLMKIDEILERGADANGRLNDQEKGIYAAERQILVSRISHSEQERGNMAANNIPHIYVLWGAPGTGKSIWAQALADLLDLGIVEVDITAQFDKWVGESGKNARKLLNMMANAKDTVFLIDEIDRQIQQGGEKNKQQQSSHETTKQVVYQFLQFFEDTNNNKLFGANGVFFVMTSNNEDCIDKALLQRTTPYEVKLPEDPEDYERFFKSYINVERARNPEYPWFQDPESVAAMSKQLANIDEKSRMKKIQEMGWNYTLEVINNKLDWKRISVEFARRREDTGSGVDFRTLKKVLQDAYTYDGIWRASIRRTSSSADASEAIKNIHGLPLTTENLLQASKFIETSQKENKRFNFGVTKVLAKKEMKLKEFIDKYAGQKLPTESYMDEFAKEFLKTPGLSEQRKQEYLAKEQKQRGILPQDVVAYMEKGEVPIEDEPEIPLPEYEGGEEIIDPETGLAKTVKGIQPKSPQQEVQELMEDSFEEGVGKSPEEVVNEPPVEQGKEPQKAPTMPPPYRSNPKPKLENKEEEKVESSTDYYYQFLQKKGILDEKGKVQIEKIREAKKQERMAKNAARNNVQKPVQKIGELFCHGFVLISEGPK